MICSLKGFDFGDTTSTKEGNPDTSSEPGRPWIITIHLHDQVSYLYLQSGTLLGEDLNCPNFEMLEKNKETKQIRFLPQLNLRIAIFFSVCLFECQGTRS